MMQKVQYAKKGEKIAKAHRTGRFLRYLKIAGCVVIVVLIVAFVLFSVFIANPFERDYGLSIVNLVPAGTDIVMIIPSSGQFWKDASAGFPWRKIKNVQPPSPLYRTCSKIQNMLSEWEKQKKMAAQNWKISLEEGIFGLAGKEIALGFKFRPDCLEGDYILMSRISFKIKVAYGASAYLIPKKIKSRFHLNFLEEIHSGEIPEIGKIYCTRYRDILFVSSSKEFLTESLKIVRENAKSMMGSSPGLKEITSQQNHGILIYCEGERVCNCLSSDPTSRKIIGSISPFAMSYIPYPYNSLCFRIALDNGKLETDFSIIPMESYKPNLNLTSQPDTEIFKFLPRKTIACATASMTWAKMWSDAMSGLPKRWRQTISPYLEKINKASASEDMAGQFLSKYFKEETVVVLSLTDFEKENLAPLDMYPAFSLLVRTENGEECVQAVEKVLGKIKDELIGKDFQDDIFARETYANRAFLRIKFPDVSGGAIRPAIGIAGQYVVFTTHISFLKSLYDIKDSLDSGLDSTLAYKNMQPFMNDSLVFFTDGDNFCKSLKNIKLQLAEFVALNYKTRNFHGFKNRIASQIEETSEWLGLFSTVYSIKVGLNNGQIKGKMVVLIR